MENILLHGVMNNFLVREVFIIMMKTNVSILAMVIAFIYLQTMAYVNKELVRKLLEVK